MRKMTPKVSTTFGYILNRFWYILAKKWYILNRFWYMPAKTWYILDRFGYVWAS